MKEVITLLEYQAEAWKTVEESILGEEDYFIHGLTSEAGEVAGVRKKYLRDDYSRQEYIDKLLLELGDTLWYLAMTCESHGFNLMTIANMNIDKLRKRQEAGTLKGDGDER